MVLFALHRGVYFAVALASIARSDQHPASRRPVRPSPARCPPRDRPTDPLLTAAAAALFVPFLRSVRCCTPSSLWECTYDVHINFGYSHPPYSSLSMSLIRLFYSFCPFLGLKCGHPLCMCACSPVALFLFHSLPRSSAKCSCMLHYCSSVSRPP